MKVFEIKITNTKDQKFFKKYVYKYGHWQNILTVFTINFFKPNNSDDYVYDIEFIDYKTASFILDEAKYYNSKLNISIPKEVIEFKKSKIKIKYPIIQILKHIEENINTSKIFCILSKIFDGNLRVVNLKVSISKSFQWLKDNLLKLCNPIKVKSV